MVRKLVVSLAFVAAVLTATGCQATRTDEQCWGPEVTNKAMCTSLSVTFLTQDCGGQTRFKLDKVTVKWDSYDSQISANDFRGRMGVVGITCSNQPIVDGADFNASPSKGVAHLVGHPDWPYVNAPNDGLDSIGANVSVRVLRSGTVRTTLCLSAVIQGTTGCAR